MHFWLKQTSVGSILVKINLGYSNSKGCAAAAVVESLKLNEDYALQNLIEVIAFLFLLNANGELFDAGAFDYINDVYNGAMGGVFVS